MKKYVLIDEQKDHWSLRINALLYLYRLLGFTLFVSSGSLACSIIDATPLLQIMDLYIIFIAL